MQFLSRRCGTKNGGGSTSMKNEALEIAYASDVPPPRLFEIQGRVVVKLLHADNAGIVIQTIGRVVRGDIASMYRIEPILLGSGRAAQVRLATHLVNGRRVAIKTFLKKNSNKEKVNMMRNEAQVALKIDHPHVARLLEVWEDNHGVHFVLEYCADGDLLQWIERKRQAGAPDYKENEEIARVLLTQIIRVVGHLHRERIVSRDIKPDHFMIDGSVTDLNDGLLTGIPYLKLIDLGLARSFSSDSRPMRATCGSLPYVAPEVLLGNYTSQCDLWSVGVILYMLLTGDPPFFGSEESIASRILDPRPVKLPKACHEAISKECIDMLNRLMAFKPSERLDAESAFRHQWILRKHPINLLSSVGNQKRFKMVVDHLKIIPKFKFFPKMVYSLMAFGLSSDKVEGMNDLFCYADHGGYGVLNPSDIESLLKQIDPNLSEDEAESIANSMDIFERGGIYYNDFLSCLLGDVIPIDDDMIRLTFWKFDRSRTGHVSVENMRQVLGNLYSDRVLERFIRESDRDGDKYIDFNEFKWILKAGIHMN